MQNLKARAWLIEEKRMIVVASMVGLPQKTIIHYVIGDTGLRWADPGDFVLMLAVGWQDRNGRDAYDGDIVQLRDRYDPSKLLATGAIIYQPMEMRYQIVVLEGDLDAFEGELGINWLPEELEIIGNRHKNPEMMKEYSDEKS